LGGVAICVVLGGGKCKSRGVQTNWRAIRPRAGWRQIPPEPIAASPWIRRRRCRGRRITHPAASPQCFRLGVCILSLAAKIICGDRERRRQLQPAALPHAAVEHRRGSPPGRPAVRPAGGESTPARLRQWSRFVDRSAKAARRRLLGVDSETPRRRRILLLRMLLDLRRSRLRLPS
jgi:hypothetical protein